MMTSTYGYKGRNTSMNSPLERKPAKATRNARRNGKTHTYSAEELVQYANNFLDSLAATPVCLQR